MTYVERKLPSFRTEKLSVIKILAQNSDIVPKTKKL